MWGGDQAVKVASLGWGGSRPNGVAHGFPYKARKQSDQVQFQGNGTIGTTATSSLTDRDVLAFFPFQMSPGNTVAAVYVMSRDLSHEYTSTPALGQTPYDEPPEQFRITIGNLNAATARVAGLYDPLTGTSVSGARIISRGSNSVVVRVPATDSPWLLKLTGT